MRQRPAPPSPPRNGLRHGRPHRLGNEDRPMFETPSPERAARRARAVALLAPACFFLGSLAAAAEPAPADKAAAPVQLLDIATCRRIALERQPSIAAAQASLDVAAARAQALCRLHAIPLLAS